jgi:hypothetical protein
MPRSAGTTITQEVMARVFVKPCQSYYCCSRLDEDRGQQEEDSTHIDGGLANASAAECVDEVRTPLKIGGDVRIRGGSGGSLLLHAKLGEAPIRRLMQVISIGRLILFGIHIVSVSSKRSQHAQTRYSRRCE